MSAYAVSSSPNPISLHRKLMYVYSAQQQSFNCFILPQAFRILEGSTQGCSLRYQEVIITDGTQALFNIYTAVQSDSTVLDKPQPAVLAVYTAYIHPAMCTTCYSLQHPGSFFCLILSSNNRKVYLLDHAHSMLLTHLHIQYP